MTTLLSEPAQAPGRRGLSLLHVWLPPTVWAVVATPGKHDWPFASSRPWLAGQIGTPGVPKIPLPGGGAGPSAAPQAAAAH